MNSPDKLPLVKQSMEMLLSNLAPDDTVAIAVYAGAAGTSLEAVSLASVRPESYSRTASGIAELDRVDTGADHPGHRVRPLDALVESIRTAPVIGRVGPASRAAGPERGLAHQVECADDEARVIRHVVECA